jgi:hypothetical protein
MSNWIEHLDELASVETDVKKKVAFQSSSRLIKDLAKGGAELRAELAALKAENAKLNSVVCQTCYGAGSVCSAPDDCYNCPECAATDNKIRADAIRGMTENVPLFTSCSLEVNEILEYAKKIENQS